LFLCRKKYFKVEDDNTFIWLNVNRNGLRKNIPQTIQAFAEFKRNICSNSLLYLHTARIDGLYNGGIQIDLEIAIRESGLIYGEDVIIPENLTPINGIPDENMNQIYNCANGFITTTLGEGFGLSAFCSMAAGTPVLVPNNSSHPEIVGLENERGYMYPCKEKIMLEGSGYRLMGHTSDIVDCMKQLWEEKGTAQQQVKITKGKIYCMINDWSRITKQWISLFEEVDNITFSNKIITDII
jgi:glycosyltransferase involved in cell wall biosynthesis